MSIIEDKDTRYFIELDLASLQVIRCGAEQKQQLDKGRQTMEGVHRLFLSRGQFHKLVNRGGAELASVLDSGIF